MTEDRKEITSTDIHSETRVNRRKLITLVTGVLLMLGVIIFSMVSPNLSSESVDKTCKVVTAASSSASYIYLTSKGIIDKDTVAMIDDIVICLNDSITKLEAKELSSKEVIEMTSTKLIELTGKYGEGELIGQLSGLITYHLSKYVDGKVSEATDNSKDLLRILIALRDGLQIGVQDAIKELNNKN